LLICGLLVGLAVSAEAESKMNVNVPFDFTIGTTLLRAGHYTVQQTIPDANPQVLSFRSANGSAQAVSMGIRLEAVNTVQQPKLVFRKYGDRYFLSQIWLSAGDSGTEIRQGKLERELARGGASPRTATVAADIP
jgi:hypothetical protein